MMYNIIFPTAFNFPIYLHKFDKLKYYTLGKRDYLPCLCVRSVFSLLIYIICVLAAECSFKAITSSCTNFSQGPPMKPTNNLENKTPLYTYWRVQLICKKVKAHSSLEPPLEYNQDQMPLTNQRSLWPLQPSLELQKCYSFSD